MDRAVDRIRTEAGDGYSALMEEELLLAVEELADCSVVAAKDRGRTVGGSHCDATSEAPGA
ncbi:Fatty-acid--CoA ligase OS=Streptomyces microflavus OX=1919 GN=Smic_68760 PE=4 SV=1 [Streptomyces microflavus]